MNGFIEVTCTRKDGSAFKRLIAVGEIISVIEDHNHAFIEFGQTKSGRAIFGSEVTESFAEVCDKISKAKGESA